MKNKLNLSLFSVFAFIIVLVILVLLKQLHLASFLRLLNIPLGLLFIVFGMLLTQKVKSPLIYLIRFLIITGSGIIILSFFKIDVFSIIKYAYLFVFHGIILGVWARTRVCEWNLVIRLINASVTLSLLLNTFLTAQNFYDSFNAILISLGLFTIIQIVILVKGQRYIKESNF